MWGLLLARADYEKLLVVPDLHGIALALRETPYGRFLDSVGGTASDAARMEEALRRNFQETLSRLLSISAGDCREAVRVLLGSWELQAVKTVLRGKAAGLPPRRSSRRWSPRASTGRRRCRSCAGSRSCAPSLTFW